MNFRRLAIIVFFIFVSAGFVGVACAAAIPSPAQQNGFFKNTFSSSFGQDVDVMDLKTHGFKWFRSKWFGWRPTSALSFSYEPGSIHLLNGSETSKVPGAANYSIASAAPAGDNNPSHWVGTAFGGGGYFEAELKFDPRTVNVAGAEGFPAWWMEPLEHMATPYSLWKGQVSDYQHFVEVDIFEYNQFGKKPPNTYSSAVHEWYGAYGKTCLLQYCQVTNYDGKTPFNNNLVSTPADTDFNQYHKYGVVWVPATDNSEGYIQYFFDGQPANTKITWKKYDDEPPVPGFAPWTFGITDRLHYVLILGTGVNQPMNVRSVNVWQASTDKNLHN